MKFIPILFSTPMVQAIIEGRKTMTRRVLKSQQTEDYQLLGYDEDGSMGKGKVGYCSFESDADILNIKCPYGKVGDVLLVRETFTMVSWAEGTTARKVHTHYKADNDLIGEHKWKPSLFMPKAACRIFLKITDIRVERLQDINRADAINEGIISWVDERMKSKPIRYASYCDFDNPTDPATYTSCPINSFETLWQSINGKESWEANPWVWVISFKRIEKPSDFC